MPREQVRHSSFSIRLAHQDCRFIVRDFVYSEEEFAKQREELANADTTEKELWVSSSDYLFLNWLTTTPI
jgi:hypothetical protein